MHYRWYSIACHKGASTQEHVISLAARDFEHAVATVRSWGYTPLCAGCLHGVSEIRAST